MSISPNVRRNCSGDTPTSFDSIGCFGMYREQFDNVYIMNNVTKVQNYVTGGAAYIDPYAIPEQRTAPDCSPYNDGGCDSPCEGNPCYCCGDFCVTNCNLPCWPIDPSRYQTCGANTSSFSIGAFHNCFGNTETTYSIQKCHQVYGWKAVAGSKFWQGRKSYLSREHLAYDSMDYCCNCSWHNYDPTPDTTKYLTMGGTATTTTVTNVYDSTVTIVGDNCCPDPLGGPDICTPNECVSRTLNHIDTQTTTATNTTHNDKFGNFFVDACSSGSSGYTDGSSAQASTFGLLTLANSDVTFNFNTYCTFYTNTYRLLGPPQVETGAGVNWHLEWYSDFTCHDHCGNLVSTTSIKVISVDLTATTLDIYTYDNKPYSSCCDSDGNCQGGVGADLNSCTSLDIIQTSHLHYEWGATTLDYTKDVTGIGSISFDATYNETVNASLATPYTQQQAKDDRNTNLLSKWDIGLDWQYPWRYLDANLTKIPYVCYDEGPSQPELGTCTSAVLYTGVIKGAPIYKMENGRIYIPDKVWDPYHKNWCICDSLVQPGCMRFYTQTWGAYSTDIGVPCASQWLDNFDANQLTQGAFDGCNYAFTVPSTCEGEPLQIFDDRLMGIKYAESIIPKESYNYFRPCGADRFMPTGSSATHCISSITDHTIILDATAGGLTDIVTGNYVTVCGSGNGMDGIWGNTISDGAYTITLVEPRIISASVLPTPPINDCGTGICSKLRWQVLQPALCGRVDIAQVSHPVGQMVTCSIPPSYLVDNDPVEVVNARGLKELNGHWPVKVIDSSHVALVGSEGLPATHTYLGSGQMYSSFSPDWSWNSEASLGNYMTVTYDYNYRDVGEWTRLQTAYTNSISGLTCDTSASCTPGFVPPQPRPHQQHCGMSQYVSNLDPQKHCLEFTSCSPAVAYFSPNVESFENGTNHGFGNAIADSQYGAGWRGMVKQSMNDPLFEAPPCPCAAELIDPTDPESGGDGNFNCSGFEWQMDDGECINDFTDLNGLLHKIFPLENQYEAEQDLPAGAPSLPPNCYIGCAKLNQFTSDITCPPANICSPPFADANACFDNGEGCNSYKIFPWATPWLTYLYEYNCVCSGGRFAAQYSANGISCETTTFPAP